MNRLLNPPNRRIRDPYVRWCGRRGVARLLPIPIILRSEVPVHRDAKEVVIQGARERACPVYPERLVQHPRRTSTPWEGVWTNPVQPLLATMLLHSHQTAGISRMLARLEPRREGIGNARFA
jgi:hypothetical protein